MQKRYMIIYYVISAVALVGMLAEICFMKKKRDRQLTSLQNKTDYFLDQFRLLNHWLEIKNEGKDIASILDDMGYHHIAIYGMGELANRLCEELEESPISIDYGIDRDVCCSIGRMDRVFSPDESLPETEAVIVTPYHDFEEIRKGLMQKLDCSIISIEEIIWSI